MKKQNLIYIAGGLLLVYYLIKKAKEKKQLTPEVVKSLTNDTGMTNSAVSVEQPPLLISPSEQQNINEFSPDTNTGGKITVRYIAGSHYI